MAVDPLIARGTQPLDVSNALLGIAGLRQRDRALAQDQQALDFRQNALMQAQQQAEDDDAEWEQAYAAKDWGRMARLDPQTTKILWDREQASKPPAPLEVQNLPGYGVAVTQGGEFKASRANPAPQQYAPETFSTQIDDQGNMLLVGNRGTIRETGRKGKTTPNPEDTKAQVERAKNEQAWSMYETAMTGLQGAMSGTVTGPVFGRVPAFSAGQQTADGAVAAMAPILKQLFRTAGEGTFTDKDQQLLLAMVPTRADRAEAREAKIANINAIVRAKLGLEPLATGGGGLTPEEQAELEELRKRFKGR